MVQRKKICGILTGDESTEVECTAGVIPESNQREYGWLSEKSRPLATLLQESIVKVSCHCRGMDILNIIT